jgi:hypothetical protein
MNRLSTGEREVLDGVAVAIVTRSATHQRN